MANSNAVVTVNTEATYRRGEYFDGDDDSTRNRGHVPTINN
jgi:hypothetical protein